MKKITLSVGLLLFGIAGWTQDSLRIQTGYLSLNREMTQTISVKGSDLEKMPFTNLSDAVAAWFYGGYTQPSALLYVVDGNPVTDVNMYSVFDIDEVLLVQNAAALGTTAAGQQELVYVRTKRGRGKSGIKAAVQGGLVDVSGNPAKAQWYQDVYAEGYRNWEKASVGLSANYLRDVYPGKVTGQMDVTPDHLRRWGLNGYFDWRPGKNNSVELTVSYTPQTMAGDFDTAYQTGSYTAQATSGQHLVVPHLYVHSSPVSGLSNDVRATYLHNRYSMTDGWTTAAALGQGNFVGTTINRQTSYHLYLSDRLQYLAHIGHVEVATSINASYEYCKETIVQSTAEVQNPPNSSPTGATLVYSASYDSIWGSPKFWFVTPALDIRYKRTFDLQGGVMIEAGKLHGPNNEQGFPFVTMTLDVLRMIHESSGSSLRLFGSYARRTVSSVVGYTLTDLGNAPVQPSLGGFQFPINGISGASIGNYAGGFFTYGVKPPNFGVGEAGMSLSTCNNRLLVQYNFERRNYETAFLYSTIFMQYNFFSEMVAALHRIDIRVRVLQSAGVEWNAGLNVTMMRVTPRQMLYEDPVLAIGDVAPAGWSETGGWVNRVRVNRFSAGLDLLYHFGETLYVPVSGGSYFVKPAGKKNSTVVPNVYAGYQWKLGAGMLEMYLESRGLARSQDSDLLDDRRYYTIGGSFAF